MKPTFLAISFFFLFYAVSTTLAGDNSIFVAGGLAKPEAIDTTYYVTGGLRLAINGSWAIEPEFGYWKQDQAEEVCLARGCVIYSLRDFHVGGNLLYTGAWKRIGIFAGGGASAHFRKRATEREVTPPENRPDLENTRFGLQILLGVDVPVSENVALTAAIRDDFTFRENPFGTEVVFKAYGGFRFFF